MAQVSTQEELHAALINQEAEIEITNDITLSTNENANYDVTITSAAGGPYTLIKGDNFNGSLFSIQEDGVLTLTNIILDGAKEIHPNTTGSLIWTPRGTLILDDGAVLQNSKGGAISHFETSTFHIIMRGNAVIRNNEVTQNGGAIYAFFSPESSIQLSGQARIENNKSGTLGGAISCTAYEYYENIVIGGDVVITGNSSNDGGALHILNGSVTITENAEISDNQANNNGGGLYIENGGLQISENAKIQNNQANNQGGGLYLASVSSESNADKSGGGQSRADAKGRVTVENNSQFTSNRAAYGGGIYHGNEMALAINGAVFSQNTATASGQDVYNIGSLELGGAVVSQSGIYIESLATVPVITQNLAADSVVQLDASTYVTPNQAGTPIVVANADLTLTAGDAAAFRAPVTGFNGWGPRLSEDSHQVLLAPIDYALQYENTKGAENPNPNSYTIYTATITLLPLASTPGNRFLGWFDAQEGGTQVTEIPVGSTGDKTLYAYWEVVEYTVTYYGNDEGGPSAQGVPGSQKVAERQSVTLSDAIPSRETYVFTGWNTDASGAGTAYQPGDTIENVAADIDLYAQWKFIPPAIHTVTYHGNDKGGPNAYGVPDRQEVLEGQSVALSNAIPSRELYVFAGWNTNPSGTGTVYQPGDTVENITADFDLYAQWIPLPPDRFTLAYFPNDAGGPPACYIPGVKRIPAGQSTQISCCCPQRACYCFTGWNTSPDGSGQRYGSGQAISSVTEDIFLYAQWQIPSPCLSLNGQDACSVSFEQ